MKLTKNLEAEILKVYNAYWDNYLKGDAEAIPPLLDDKYTQVGSAEGEVFLNKKDAVQFIYDTIDQVAGKLEMRKRETKLEQQDNIILIHERCDLYALADGGWIFYSKFRATTLMQQKKERWKITHQHSSFPDTKAEEGQNIAIDKIAEENLLLREAVKRRTIELEHKNRDLEIESALERVRTVAMGMNKPDDILGICKVMFAELQSLGFSDLRNTLINFWDDASNSLLDYDYSDFAGGNKAKLSYSSHPVFEQFQKKIKKSKDAFAKLVVKKDQLESWKQRRRDSGEYEDTRLNDIAALYYYFYSFGVGAIGISTFRSLTVEKINLLKRFRNVFDLAYRRYHDIKKAEAQAREAQIELALERVRARTMGMQKSEELGEVSHVMNEQLQQLDFKNYIAGFLMDYNNSDDFEVWRSDPSQVLMSKTHIPYFHHPIFKEFIKAKEKGLDFNTLNLTFEEKNKWVDYVLPYFPAIPEEIKNLLYSGAGYAVSCAYMKNVAVFIENFEGILFSKEENAILKRFAKVFEQTYTRFLDLQKAEAQAREAQIQLALERVRARTMAMHQSSELIDVVSVLMKQLNELKFDVDLTGIHPNFSEQPFNYWMASVTRPNPEKFDVPYKDIPFMKKFQEAAKLKKELLNIKFDKKEKDQWVNYLFQTTSAAHISPESKEFLLQAPSITCSMVKETNVAINIGNYRGIKYTDADHAVMRRFASVFEQSYTRFLDLEKAEAQAKEAQIEAGLERVRSRTMGMQKSEELKEVIQVVYDQFVQLNILVEHAGFIMDYKIRDDMNIWLADRHEVPFQVTIPYFDCAHWNSFNKSKEKGTDFFANHLSFEEKNRFYQDLFKLIPGVPEETKEYYFSCPGLAISTVLLDNVGLYIENFSGIPYSDEENNTLMRFGKVFQQTYTRFLDLQKAEAQAKEAKVETALEKVRSSTIGMHHSNDLHKVINVVNEQLQHLDFRFDATTFITDFDENNKHTLWLATPGQYYPFKIDVPSFKHRVFDQIVEEIKQGSEFVTYILTYEEKNKFFSHLLENTVAKNIDNEIKQQVYNAKGMAASAVVFEKIIFTVSNYGAIPYTIEENTIIKRVANVFEQSYTRFLDLQKAEAQAREAQIEAALEKVRAKVMAMNSSKELNDTSLVFGEQLRKLGIDWQFSYFWLIEEVKEVNTFWITWPDNKTSTTTYTWQEANESFGECIIAWKRQDKIHSTHVPVEAVQAWLDTFERITADAGGAAVEIMKPGNFGVGVYFYDAIIKFGSFGILTNRPINDEEKNIQVRFATEFERAYTRFLDLQKAEAQAREAQIESGLERVRSKTMAMHKSEEVTGVAVSLNEELLKLGFEGGSTIIILNRETGDTEQWTGFSEDKSIKSCYVPYFKHPCLDALLDSWKKGDNFLVYTLAGDEKKSLDEHYFATGYKIFPESDQKWMREMKSVTFSHAFMKYGAIHWGPDHLTEEQLRILQRFSKVFEQSYTRFLDLQKAEAQAREAQIEAALERVRSRTMAMYQSKELNEAAELLYKELTKLGIEKLTCGYTLLDDITGIGTCYMANPEGNFVWEPFRLDHTGSLVFNSMYESWKNQEPFHLFELSGQVNVEHNRYLAEHADHFPMTTEQLLAILPPTTFSNSFNFRYGYLLVVSLSSFTKEHCEIISRFARVFEQTYTRFLDLQKAEGQAREAKIEASLERVRSKAMAMQKSEDLADAVAIVFEELDKLNLGMMRCGIGILNKEKRIAYVWTTTKSDNDTVVQVSGDESMDIHPLLQGAFNAWLNQVDYSYILKGEDLNNYYKALSVGNFRLPDSQSLVSGAEGVEQYYYNAIFSSGGLFAFRETEFPEEAKIVLRRFADVFNLTYTRFNDLKVAEAHARQAEEDLVKLQTEKKRAEDALKELRAAQAQLIQSEKMASLGELTAGIAHEIQNPLNFVNNFSEVNKELLAEMAEEIEKGNYDEAKALAKHVEDNQEKINHHGKRADAIVKGMLHHSRSNTGIKESTDINKLVDEYLRLAYHGLRAKDKSFNATLKTDFDESFGNIDIIPQDVGRAILNLITNAFYAVTEKKKEVGDGYEPIVSLCTRKINGTIEIKVKDNGNGIAQKVLDKIFQPFFTTKPTGQGTGLGLSLSYDIVKGHGGEIIVETKEGEGTTFTIQLPHKK